MKTIIGQTQAFGAADTPRRRPFGTARNDGDRWRNFLRLQLLRKLDEALAGLRGPRGGAAGDAAPGGPLRAPGIALNDPL